MNPGSAERRLQPSPRRRGGTMSIVAFSLSMPGVASWNNRWSGEGKLYARLKSMPLDRAKKLEGSYSYAWPDGWCARVAAQIVDSKEAARLRKKSAGFCGYDWMIDSIIRHGKIMTP